MTSNEKDAISQAQPERVFGVIGETPITGAGLSWLPLTQLILWGIFTRSASRRKPGNSRLQWSREGFLRMAAMVGSEWCHNLAHLAVSNWVGKPMDKMRIQLGMPRCIYYEINDREVSPRQHMLRSLAGPLVNLLLLPAAGWALRRTQPGTIAGDTAKTAYQTNLFLSLVSLLPIPGIDGGPLLKWSLVERGRTIEAADLAVRKVNGPLALFLGLFSSWAFLTKKILAGALSLMLGATSLSIFAGWLKEEDVPV